VPQVLHITALAAVALDLWVVQPQEDQLVVVMEARVDHIQYLDHHCFMVAAAEEETITEEQ
jgi:hypothetical protein